jgi:3-oxoacyl-[acyl-carrier-protein] synthase III
MPNGILKIGAYGAWHGGIPVDNSVFENRGMFFKGGIPVSGPTIEDRVGVRIRMMAPSNERIGVLALKDLLQSSRLDPARIKLVIGATNVGDDKFEPGPLIRHPYEVIRRHCPQAMVFDLYAGCPGFNVAVETAFMLSAAGILKPGDVTIIVGAENIHRAGVFKPLDTSNIIFGDDALATALETIGPADGRPGRVQSESIEFDAGSEFVAAIAKRLTGLNGSEKLDGIIIDNQLGQIEYRIPATAARVQHAMVERMHPEAVAGNVFGNFRGTIEFYRRQVESFAFDVMTLDAAPRHVRKIADAFVKSGRYRRVASIFLGSDHRAKLTVHQLERACAFAPPQCGVLDTHTSTHGCFAGFIEAVRADGDVFGSIDGKGVFLHATRGVKHHLGRLLERNQLTMENIDLMIEHQANFAMIPMMLEQLIGGRGSPDTTRRVADFIADRMVTNVHLRGNCSVVCMQRLPYDLQRDALAEDTIQGYTVNRSLAGLRQAKLLLFDSVGAGMTRSSFLYRKPSQDG